jgi:hypothetical protein
VGYAVAHPGGPGDARIPRDGSQMQAEAGLRQLPGRDRGSLLGRHWRPAVLGCWTAVWFAILARNGGIAWKFFVQGSLLLFTGHDGGSTKPAGLHLYASYPQLQIGPLAFGVAQVLRHLGPDNGIAAAELVMTAAGFLVLYAIERIALAVRPELALAARGQQRAALAGRAVFMIAWVELAVEFGHLDDVIALLCAVLAAWAGVARRPVLTGLCVGLAVDAKPWALVFLPLLLLADGTGQAGLGGRRPAAGTAWPPALGPPAAGSRPSASGPAIATVPPARASLPGPVLACVMTIAAIAAGWLPFYLADPGTMAAAHFTITNLPDSAVRALGVRTARTPSWDRPAQLVAGCAVGTLAIWRRRWAGAILLAVGARIALDPGAHAYYTAGVMAGALLWDTVGARRPWPLWSLLSLGALTGVPLLTGDAAVQGRFRLGLLITFTLAILLMPARCCREPAEDSAAPSGATTTPTSC